MMCANWLILKAHWKTGLALLVIMAMTAPGGYAQQPVQLMQHLDRLQEAFVGAFCRLC